jgi:hypothetical protein
LNYDNHLQTTMLLCEVVFQCRRVAAFLMQQRRTGRRDEAKTAMQQERHFHRWRLTSTPDLHCIPLFSSQTSAGGLSGLRLGEIRALAVEQYDGETVFVKQSAWRSHLKDTKTKASKAHVPVIAQLAARIDAHIERMGSPTSGLLFPNGAGKPLDVQRMVDEVVRPALAGSGIE